MSIILTFLNSTDIADKDRLAPWLQVYFPSAEPLGQEQDGNGYEVMVSLKDFEENKNKVPTSNLVRARGCFTIIEMICLGVRDFDNDLRDKDFLRKIFPHSKL